MVTAADIYRLAKGPFKMGWLLVMFDLPVSSKQQQERASKFRQALLDDGFIMMQFSIYMRACPTYERMKKHQIRLKRMTPAGGNVRILFITDKQWEKSISIIGKNYNRKISPANQMRLSEFW